MSRVGDRDEGLDLSGRRVVVTGAAGGVGAETVRALAAAGAEVTLAVRRLEQGEALAAQLRAERPSARLRAARLDLDDLPGIARFAADRAVLSPRAACGTCPSRSSSSR